MAGALGRVVSVRIADVFGMPLPGADVAFFVDGQPIGEVRGCAGAASVHLPDPHATLHTIVTHSQGTLTASISPEVDTYVFNFSFARGSLALIIPEARCPDGTSGQPCVDCVIDGKIIRICA